MYNKDWCNPMTAQDTLLTKIIEKYTLHPCVCSCCGTPLSLDSYFEQFDKFYKSYNIKDLFYDLPILKSGETNNNYKYLEVLK